VVWHWRWFRAGRALVAQSLFLLFSASVYWVVLASLAPEAVSRVPVGVVPGAAIAAWLIGLVTPGAPAGLGVREAVMLLILGVWVPQADLVLAVLLARLVNIAGDVGFFAACVVSGRGR
jgi:glycosyltransferase 2 family protein